MNLMPIEQISPEKEVDAPADLVDAMRERGQVAPIVINQHNIVRPEDAPAYYAALELGWTEIAVYQTVTAAQSEWITTEQVGELHKLAVKLDADNPAGAILRELRRVLKTIK